MDQRYYGLRCQVIKHMDFKLAIRNGLNHPFNEETSAAGRKGFGTFYKGIQ
jgi:hypothetical protein